MNFIVQFIKTKILYDQFFMAKSDMAACFVLLGITFTNLNITENTMKSYSTYNEG